MTTFIGANALRDIKGFWFVEIEGIRLRFGSGFQPSWNPADTGVNRYINKMLARVPQIGSQEADPLNGSCNIPSHEFSIVDDTNYMTDLLSVANTPKTLTFLTGRLAKGATQIPVAASADFDLDSDIYIDRETIHFTGRTTATHNGTAETITGQTCETDPVAPSKKRIYDTARTEVNDYWVDAVITFTSGSNNGFSTRIIRSLSDVGPLQSGDESYSTLVLKKSTTNNIANGDQYTITHGRRRIYDSTIPADFTGAYCIITDDTDHPENIGWVGWVKSYASNTIELYEPLPYPAGTNTDFTLYKKWLTGCTRGMYGTIDCDHEVIDDHGTAVCVEVSDKPRYIKTRRAWIKEGREGCAESELKTINAVIDDWAIEPDGCTYTFKCSGLMRLLSSKVLVGQAKGKVALMPVWGGKFKAEAFYTPDPGAATSGGNGNPLTVKYTPVMDDAETKNFALTEIYYSAESPFPAPCNVKVGEEIMRINEASTYVTNEQGAYNLGFFTSNVAFTALKQGGINQIALQGDLAGDYLGLRSRGLFAEKFGYKIKKPLEVPDFDNWPEWAATPQAREVSGFIQEHKIDDDIVQVCLCDGSNRSDFPEYDRLDYSSDSGSMSTLPVTVTGGSSGATATVMKDDTTYNQLTVICRVGEFQDGETITATGGWSATLTTCYKGDGSKLPARNNPINVLLQLMMSSGTLLKNGIYDTLPKGWGLDWDATMVDTTEIERIRNLIFSKTTVDFVLHEPTSLKEWAEKNIFILLQVFPHETPDGKISFGYLFTEQEAQALDLLQNGCTAIGATQISCKSLPDWTSGQMPIEKVNISHNKHPVSDDFFGKIEIVFARNKRILAGQGRTVELEAGSLYVSGGLISSLTPNAPDLPELVSRIINPMWGRHGSNPCPVIEVSIPYNYMTLEIGEVIKFTHAGLPNLRTGSRGITNDYYQVMAKRPDPESGEVKITLWCIGVHDNKYGRVAPSAIVDHIHKDTPSAGKTTVELKADRFNDPGGDDASDFLVGEDVMFFTSAYDLLGGSSPEAITIESKGVNYVVLDALPTYDPYSGCIMEVASYDNASSTRKSTTVFLADPHRVLGSSADTAFKYM